MKKHYCVKLSILLFSFILAGCSLPTNPYNLVKPPGANEQNLSIKQEIDEQLPPNARLTIPAPNKGISTPFSNVDLNGDGQEEVVAYYRMNEDKFKLGLMVLGKNADGTLEKIDTITEYGQEIAYTGYVDVTGDKVKDLLIGWSGGQGLANNLAVYTLAENHLKQVGNISYNEVATGDLDDNLRTDIAISTRVMRENIPIVAVEVYEYSEGKLNKKYTTDVEGYPGKIVIGKAQKDSKGLFVETGYGAHSAATQILLVRANALKPVFSQAADKPLLTFKPYPLDSKDVNNDGIIEIGILLEPPLSDALSMVAIAWVENWYQWDGKEGITWVKEIYADYGQGLQWEIPAGWKDKYTVSKKDAEGIFSVEFYALEQNRKEQLFTLEAVDSGKWPEYEKKLQDGKVKYLSLGINKSLGKEYLAVLPAEVSNSAAIQQLFLSLEQIKQNFCILDVGR